MAQVAQSLRPAFAGIDAGDWVDPTGETRDVTVRLTPEARESLRIVLQPGHFLAGLVVVGVGFVIGVLLVVSLKAG